MRWLERALCFHRFTPTAVDRTGEYGTHAMMYGNVIVRLRCQKCGKKRTKIGYLPC